MRSDSRFERPSGRLALGSLRWRPRTVLWSMFGVALVLHLSLSQWRALAKEEKAAKPLTTQFIKRQPRLTKPLELKKRPQPRRRPLERRMVAVQARADRRGVAPRFEPILTLGSLAQPGVFVTRGGVLTDIGTEPHALARNIEGAKEVEHKLDMSLELLNIEALDTGQYHALIVQDADDKRGIRGFLHLAVVYSRSMYPPKYPAFEEWIAPVMPRMAQAMNRYTKIRTDILGKFSLDCTEIFRAPWLYFMAFWPFELTDSELDNLGRYMLSGGFVFADSRYGNPPWRGGALSVSSSVLNALAGQGIQLAYEKLPKSHPVYHCYYDFDVPPAAGDSTAPEVNKYGAFDYVEGVSLGERLLALFSRKGYYQPWARWNDWTGAWPGRDNTRQLQFGINTIILALAQEGSITRRLMDAVR